MDEMTDEEMAIADAEVPRKWVARLSTDQAPPKSTRGSYSVSRRGGVSAVSSIAMLLNVPKL